MKIAVRLATILSLSSVRSRRAAEATPKGFAKRATANLYASAMLLPIAAMLAYLVGPVLLGEEASVEALSGRLLVIVPSLATFLSLMYSMMFELNQSSEAASTDLLSWLPVSPGEYVAGSALCTAYFISPMIALLVGVCAGLALRTGTGLAWALSTVLVFIGVVLGISISEIARSLLNRASAGLAKRNATPAIALRLIIGVGMIVILAAVFNVNLFLRILGWFVDGVNSAWFVPVLWPSMAVTAALRGALAQATGYSILGFSFALLLLVLAVATRSACWVPVPAAAKLGGFEPTLPRRSILRVLGFSIGGAALIRKDLRSLVRRREMTIWIAVPTVFFLMSAVNWGTGMEEVVAGPTMSRLGWLTPMGLGVLFLSFYISLVGFGQEGKSFIHLLVAPLHLRQIVRAKLAASMIPATLVFAVVLIIIGLAIRPGWAFMSVALILGVATMLEASLIGLALGARYADFAEVPRARFIERKGAYIGMLLTASAAGVTVFPVLVVYLFPGILGPAVGTMTGLSLATAICVVSHRSLLSRTERLFARETG